MLLAALMLNNVRISVCLLLSLTHDGQKQALFANNIITCIEKTKTADESRKKGKGKKESSGLSEQTSADLKM